MFILLNSFFFKISRKFKFRDCARLFFAKRFFSEWRIASPMPQSSVLWRTISSALVYPDPASQRDSLPRSSFRLLRLSRRQTWWWESESWVREASCCEQETVSYFYLLIYNFQQVNNHSIFVALIKSNSYMILLLPDSICIFNVCNV